MTETNLEKYVEDKMKTSGLMNKEDAFHRKKWQAKVKTMIILNPANLVNGEKSDSKIR